MNDALHPDAGMTLVELIVGLAIASVLALTIGGLLTFSIEARDRIDQASRIEASLIELKRAAGVLDRYIPIDAEFHLTGDGSSLVMSFEAPGRKARSVIVELRSPAVPDPGVSRTLKFEDDLGRIVGPVALDAFDGANLEFLSLQAGRLVWRTDKQTASVPLLGMRIVLGGGGRQWPVLLWAARSMVQA